MPNNGIELGCNNSYFDLRAKQQTISIPSNIGANNVQKEIETFKVNMSLFKKVITLPLSVHIKLDS